MIDLTNETEILKLVITGMVFIILVLLVLLVIKVVKKRKLTKMLEQSVIPILQTEELSGNDVLSQLDIIIDEGIELAESEDYEEARQKYLEVYSLYQKLNEKEKNKIKKKVKMLYKGIEGMYKEAKKIKSK